MKQSRHTVAKKIRHRTAYERFEQLKDWVNFKFVDDDKTARRLLKIEREIGDLIKQPHTRYGGKKIKQVLKATGARGIHGPKAVPVPSDGVKGRRVRVTKDGVAVVSQNVVQSFIGFNKRKLVSDPNYTAKLVAPDLDKKGVLFKVQTGQFEMKGARTADEIPAVIAKLKEAYKVGGQGFRGIKVKKGQQYTKWLNGLIRMETKNQISPAEYDARRERNKKIAYKAARKKKKQKARKH